MSLVTFNQLVISHLLTEDSIQNTRSGFHFCLKKFPFLQIQHKGCDILDGAIERYKTIIGRMLRRDFYDKIKPPQRHHHEHPNLSFRRTNSYFTGFLDEILINLTYECEDKPNPAMKEECKFSNSHLNYF